MMPPRKGLGMTPATPRAVSGATARRRPVVRPERQNELAVGARLRAGRRARGLTLEQVAAATGLTKGFLSRLERDDVSPSVASLVGVCDVLGLRVGALFDPPDRSLVRAGEGQRISFGGQHVIEHLLTPGSQSAVQVLHSNIEPGGTGGVERYVLDSDVEFVYVVAGQFVVELGEEPVQLGPGDAFTFCGRDPHTWHNASTTDPAEVLWVLSPAP